MITQNKAIRLFRKLLKQSMIRPALAERIIRCIKCYRWAFITVMLTSCLALFVVLSSYFMSNSAYRVLPLSYAVVLSCSRRKNPFGRDFWVENLGGDGSPVAAYLRVSTEKQIKGMSLEVQKEKIEKMKMELKPSLVFWFVDAGMSGQDFDKRKISRILKLKEKNEIQELWVTHIDRIGRACRKSLLFFLQFTEDNGIVRTPEKTFTSKELADILLYAIESFGAEEENQRRAERANASKVENFKRKKWNKPIPLGYARAGEWITKVETFDLVIREIFSTAISCGCISRTTRLINCKYGKVLDTPLKRGRLMHLLSDPVYIGRPTLMGTIVVDDSLRFIEDEVFRRAQELLGKKNQKAKKPSAMAQLALTYDLSLLDFIEKIADFSHKGCGGKLVKNGPRFEGLILQQAFKCSLCGSEFRIPTKSMLNLMRRLNQQHKPASEEQVIDQKTSSAQRNEVYLQKTQEKAESQRTNAQKTLMDFC